MKNKVEKIYFLNIYVPEKDKKKENWAFRLDLC
jgi:hypothetical protein